MGSRNLKADNVYAAADTWIDSALRRDDSLFTPGVPIWSSGVLAEARARFLDKPDILKGAGFLEKLEPVLKGNPQVSPELCQLMGEGLYVSYLILHKGKIGQSKKIENVKKVLGWSRKPVTVPVDLRDGLREGIMAPGGFFDFGAALATVVKFAELWKSDGSDISLLDRNAPAAPWRFKALLVECKCITPAKQVPLLHLVHPDSFEAMAYSHKMRVAKAPRLQRFVTDATSDEDRKLKQIRAALEAKPGIPENFDFFKPPVSDKWVKDE